MMVSPMLCLASSVVCGWSGFVFTDNASLHAAVDLIGVASLVNDCMNKMNPSFQDQASDQLFLAGRDVI